MMNSEPQTDVSLEALRQAIRDDNDAEIVRLYTASESDDFQALTRQEHVRIDLAIRRVNNRRAVRALVPYAVGALVLVVAAIVAALVIVPRLVSRPSPTPGTPTDAVLSTATTPLAPTQASITRTPDPALAGAQGRAVSRKRTSTQTSTPVAPTSTPQPTPVPTSTHTVTSVPMPPPTDTPTQTSVPPTSTQTPTQTLVPPTSTQTHTPVPTPTHTPTSTQTPTHTPTNTRAPLPTPTRTPVVPTRTPSPTVGLRPAPRLEAPPNGAEFAGWNAEVILRWSSLGALAADEYYVVRIPYDDAGGVAEFWRKETSFQVPPHFSGRQVGFPDRHYNWTVQAMRCIGNCASVTDDNVRKSGRATSAVSIEGLFYWHSDIGGGAGPGATPTRD